VNKTHAILRAGFAEVVEAIRSQPVSVGEAVSPVFQVETVVKQPISQAEQVRLYLQQYPEDRQLSLRTLAARVGVSYSTVRRVLQEIESSTHIPGGTT
jgi:hypothetical protein